MISWQIWQALHQPPRSDRLFQRAFTEQHTLQSMLPNRVVLGGIIFLGIAAFISRELSSLLSFAILLVIPIMAANYLLTGLIYGLRWAVLSGQAIAGLQRSNQYDLLSLTPPGPLGMSWAVSTGTFYKSLGTIQLDLQSMWPMRMFIVLPLTIFLSISADPDGDFYRLRSALAISLYMGVLIAWFRFEDIQSIVLGGLIGMLIPVYTHNRLEVYFGTIASFVSLHVLLYASSFALLAFCFPALYGAFGWQGWFASFSRPALTVAFVIAARESIIWFMWRRLTHHLREPQNVRLNARQRV